MTRSLWALALTLSLGGCQAAGNLAVTPGIPPNASGGATAPSPTRLGTLDFKAVSAETAAAMASRASATPTSQAPPADARSEVGGATAGTAMARPAMMPMPGSPYSHGSYFSGPYGNMKLDSVTEAKTTGVAGGWAEAQAGIVGPALSDWAADARMISSNATLTEQGDTWAGANGEEGGWHVTYASASRNEVLEFHVGTASSRVVKLHWTPIPLNMATATVDAKAAIAKVTAAVTDRAARSKEDELGHDYFFAEGDGKVMPMDLAVSSGVSAGSSGSGSGSGSGTATATVMVDPAPPVAPVTTSIAVGEPTPGGMPAPDQMAPPTQLYTLTPGGRWYASFQSIGGYDVWELNYQPAVWNGDAEKGFYFDAGAYAMIDAKTGDLIRLRRPTKYPQHQAEPGIEPMPAPRPMDSDIKK